jgi:hypothetical protein
MIGVVNILRRNKAEPEMVKLPVYDIHTDTVVEPPLRKKPGRKPKHDQTPA